MLTSTLIFEVVAVIEEKEENDMVGDSVLINSFNS